MARNCKHKRPYNRGRSVTFRLRMTPEERAQLDADAADAGYDEASAYVRSILFTVAGAENSPPHTR